MSGIPLAISLARALGAPSAGAIGPYLARVWYTRRGGKEMIAPACAAALNVSSSRAPLPQAYLSNQTSWLYRIRADKIDACLGQKAAEYAYLERLVGSCHLFKL